MLLVATMDGVDTAALVMDGKILNRARMSHVAVKHPTQSLMER